MTSIAALIVAAGKGERAGGGLPKQYQALAGRPLLRWSVERFRACPGVNEVLVVIGPRQEEAFATATAGLGLAAPVTGGDTRQDSVRNGLEALSAKSPSHVLIHDAARPLASEHLIRRVIEKLESGAEAAIPMLAVADTIRRKDPAGRWQIVPREGMQRAQTPQGFRFDAILAAHRAHKQIQVTDDMAIAELAGMKIAIVEGEEMNLKVTNPADFGLAEKLLSARSETRTGMGFDAHRFVAGDHVWLCGIRVPHDRALEGHSDADAGLHALTDAILGALGAGDIGVHFPPSDAKWRGAPSHKFVEHAVALVKQAGGRVLHCDVTLICERPKVGPHREAMRARIAEIIGIEIARVSVKATTTEGMGFTGRGEGLAAQAVATIALG